MRCESAHAVSITGIPNRLDRHSTADCDLEDGHLGSHEGAALDKRWWWNDHGCGSLRPTDQKVDVASLRERLKQPRVDYHLRRDVLFLIAEVERLRAALLSSDRAVHPEIADRICPFCGDPIGVLKPSGGCLTADINGYVCHPICADEFETFKAAASDRAVKEPDQRPKEWECICTHHYRAHDRNTGRCNEGGCECSGYVDGPASFELKPVAAEGLVSSPASQDTRKECTCLGTCRGADGLGAGWKCALENTKAPILKQFDFSVAGMHLLDSPRPNYDHYDKAEWHDRGIKQGLKIARHILVEILALAEVSSPARPQLQLVERIIDRLRMRISQWRDTQQRDKAAAEAVSKVLIRHALESSSELHEGFANSLECDLEDFEKWVAEGAASSAPPAVPPFKHLTDEITAAHQALDRAGVPLTKAVRKREGEGQHDITMGLADRIAAIRPSAPPALEQTMDLDALSSLAEVLTNEMFRDPGIQRLVLTIDEPMAKNMGGWSRKAFEQTIYKALVREVLKGLADLARLRAPREET